MCAMRPFQARNLIALSWGALALAAPAPALEVQLQSLNVLHADDGWYHNAVLDINSKGLVLAEQFTDFSSTVRYVRGSGSVVASTAGTFTALDGAVLNDRGSIAIAARTISDERVLLDVVGNPRAVIARTRPAGTPGTTFSGFLLGSGLSISNTDRVLFAAEMQDPAWLSPQSGLFLRSRSGAASSTTVAVAGPNGFDALGRPVLNNKDHAAFWVRTFAGIEAVTVNSVAVASTQNPHFRAFDPFFLSINDNSVAAFVATLDNGSRSILTGRAGGAVTEIANTAATVLDDFGGLALNLSGTVAFLAARDGGGQGIYVATGTAFADLVAQTGATYGRLTAPRISDAGVVAFVASDASDPFKRAMVVADGTGVQTLLKPGDPLAGFMPRVSTVLESFALSSSGHLAFVAVLQDGTEVLLRALLPGSAGSAHNAPVLPDVSSGGSFVFNTPTSGLWFDPPPTQGFDFALEGAGEFQIVEVAPGFVDLQLIVDGVVVESDLDAGERYAFAAGVKAFTITGISPGIEAAPDAFPTYLEFSGDPTLLRMTALPVPEPATPLLWLAGTGWLVMRARRSRHRAFGGD